jgi:hypothetical protein
METKILPVEFVYKDKIVKPIHSFVPATALDLSSTFISSAGALGFLVLRFLTKDFT